MNWRIHQLREVSKRRQRLYSSLELARECIKPLLARNGHLSEDNKTAVINAIGDVILGVHEMDYLERVFNRLRVRNALDEAETVADYLRPRMGP
jgi:hypothetical protein